MLNRHIACDPGAERLARALGRSLDAPVFAQPYSRLVIDCNRPLDAPDLILTESDNQVVPGNCRLSPEETARRVEEIHRPYHWAIARELDRQAASGEHSILLSIHSFAPVLAGEARPRHIGLLIDPAGRDLADRLHPLIDGQGLIIGLNEPYRIDQAEDYTIPVHGQRRGFPNLLLEVRQDLLADAAGVARIHRFLAKLRKCDRVSR